MDHAARIKILMSGAGENPLEELLVLGRQVHPSFPEGAIRELHQDVANLFAQSQRVSSWGHGYHDFNHTSSVALATARLFHGLHSEGCVVAGEQLEQGIYSAYFHDIGLLQLPGSTVSSENGGIRGHEQRSFAALLTYLRARSFPEDFIKGCKPMILCTSLEENPAQVEFASPAIKQAAFALATADILAQMADRCYLERLPQLYQEMVEGGVKDYTSAVELMGFTSAFYQQVVLERIHTSLGNMARYMKAHFRERWGVNRNLYQESIFANIEYIRKIVSQCQGSKACLDSYLRRETPA